MLYVKPIDQIDWDAIDNFCQQRLQEGAYLDYKRDFPAHLEKTVAAMANTFGGIILIGVEEDNEGKPLLPVRGMPFKRGLEERVWNIILENIVQPVFPEISVVLNSKKDRAFVLIRIPESHQTPHAIAGNTEVYLRTGNRNKPEKLVSMGELGWLQNKRKKSDEFRNELYEQSGKRLENFMGKAPGNQSALGILISPPGYVDLGNGRLEISLCPLFPKDPFRTPPEMREVLGKIRVPEYYSTQSGFPIPDSTRGIITSDAVVLFDGSIKENAFYTEINSFGLYLFWTLIVVNLAMGCVRGNPFVITCQIRGSR